MPWREVRAHRSLPPNCVSCVYDEVTGDDMLARLLAEQGDNLRDAFGVTSCGHKTRELGFPWLGQVQGHRKEYTTRFDRSYHEDDLHADGCPTAESKKGEGEWSLVLPCLRARFPPETSEVGVLGVKISL